MVAIISGARSPRLPLQEAVDANSGADGDIVESYAAMLRHIMEVLDGSNVNAYGAVPMVAPPSPLYGFTLPGHDHSGGMAGKPQKHTVWQQPYGSKASLTGSYLEAPRVEQGAGTGVIIQCKIPVWIPPGAIYRQLRPALVLRCEGGGCDLQFKVSNGGSEVVATPTLGSGTNDVDGDTLLACVPGRINQIEWRVFADNIGGTAAIYLYELRLNQVYENAADAFPLP